MSPAALGLLQELWHYRLTTGCAPLDLLYRSALRSRCVYLASRLISPGC